MDANRASNNEHSSSDEFTRSDLSHHAPDDGTSKSSDGDSQTPRPVQRGGTTSALTRDAARLRSVMVQATERSEAHQLPGDRTRMDGASAAGDDEHATNDARNRGDLARAAAMPSLPDLADTQATAVAQHDPQVETEAIHENTPVPAGSRRPTSLRSPLPAGKAERAPLSAQDQATNGATKLKPVAALRPETMTAGRSNASAMDAPIKSAAVVTTPAAAMPVATAPSMSASPNVDRDRATPDQHIAPPIFTEIERKASYSYGVEEKPPTQGERIGIDAPSHHIAIEQPRHYTPPSRRRGANIGRNVLAGVTVLVGTAIGIGLYAGGGDLLSDLFSNNNEGVAVVSPSTVPERPVVPPPSSGVSTEPAPGIEGGRTPNASLPVDSHPGAVAPAQAPTANAPATTRSAEQTSSREDVRAGSSRPEPTVIDAEERSPSGSVPTGRTQRRETSSTGSSTTSAARPSNSARPVAAVEPKAKSDEKATADKAKAPAGKYVVQVRATPDEAEAKLIAKRLRGKGASNVTVVPSKAKDGTTLYRVRYNTTGTASEAQAAATRAGYKNVWVVKQNK